MGLIGTVVNIIGVVFLSHAVYSAYEHSLLPTASTPLPPSRILPRALDPKINLPLDITLETLFSVLLLCVGVVLTSPDLKPIQWSTWAGGLERDASTRKITEAGQVAGNPYEALEERPGFLDVKGIRKGYAQWVKEGGK